MHRVIALLAVSTAGCDAVFGLGHVRDEPDAPPEAFAVTGRYHQRYPVNDPTFQPVIMDRVFPVGALGLAAFLDDGTEVNVDYSADGTFTFPLARAGQAYRFAVTAEGTRSEYQSSAPHLQLAGSGQSRPDRAPVQPTIVQFGFPISGVATGSAYIATTGIRTFTSTAMVGPQVTFDWRLSQPAGASGMLDAAKNDRIYTLEYGTAPGGYSALHSVGAASITQLANQKSTAATPALVNLDHCVRFSAENATEHDRLVAAVPRAYTASLGNWVVFDVPSAAQLGTAGAIQLAQIGQSPAANVDLAPTFYDPFPGGDLLVQAAAGAQYNITLAGTATPFVLGISTSVYDPIEAGLASSCMSPHVDAAATVGIAGAPSVDGTSLDNDGQVLALDLSRDVPVTWSLAADGPVQTTVIQIYEVLAAGTATNVVYQTGFWVSGESGLLDHTMLLDGHSYVLLTQTRLGYPNAADGDWDTQGPSYQYSTVWSHYFTVQAR